jgi:hypothetical protein
MTDEAKSPLRQRMIPPSSFHSRGGLLRVGDPAPPASGRPGCGATACF